MQVALSPTRAHLKLEVQRCEERLESLETLANYSRDRDWFEPAMRSAARKKTLSSACLAGGAVAIGVGMAVPALALALPVGLVVGIYAGIAFRAATSEMRSVEDAKEQNAQTVALFDQHIQGARSQLSEARRQLAAEGDEPAEAVRQLVDGIKRSTEVLEDSARVTFAGVSLRKKR